jgi:hypothetical protein
MNRITLVVQPFIKTDTLHELCASLCNCTGIEDLRLIFWCDSSKGSRKEDVHAPLQREVMQFLDGFRQNSSGLFESVEIHENPENLGPYKTCKIAIDYAFRDSSYVVFAEDDVVFSRDAILWFKGMRDLGVLTREEIWAVAGESVFFDARKAEIPPGLVEDAIAAANAQVLATQYIQHKFVPSTCFATSREKWQEFGSTRGEPAGDVKVCERCEAENKFSIFPIVARAKDTGMLHALGYSVMLHTKENVAEHKQTYLLSDMLTPMPELGFQEFQGNAGLLFQQSTLLEGFKHR